MHKVFKGALAGLVGGIAGAAAKAYAERIFPPGAEKRTQPFVLDKRTAGRPFDEKEQISTVRSLDWAFGGLAGAAYGVTVEFLPSAKTGKGTAFGLLLHRLTHEGAFPAYGLAPQVSERPAQEKRSERMTHAVYGVVTEFVRSIVRRRI